MRGEGGLKAAAAVTGTFVGIEQPYPEGDAKNLVQLVSASEAIVVGEIKRNLSWLDDTGKKIVTDYQVKIERALMGQIREGAEISVSVPGGRVSFPDGSTGHIYMPGAPPPANGQRFVFFLSRLRHAATGEQRAAAKGPMFSPALKTLGMFRLSSDRGVVPLAPPKHPLKLAFSRNAEADFVSKVSAAVSSSKVGAKNMQK